MLALAVMLPLPAQPQRSSNLGLAAIGALGAHASQAWLERADRGYEAGLLADLGWTTTPLLRIQTEVNFLAAHLVETVDIEDRTYRGPFFDLNGAVSAVLLAKGRVAPFLVAGVDVHALSSDFGSLTLDRRYNTNQFGVTGGAGLRLWTGRSGRHFLSIEVRRGISENVDRTVVRVGFFQAYNDLVRPR